MLGVTFRLFASIYSRMINNDNIIIQRIRSGETWEFGLLVNSYGSALMAFVGRIVDQQEDAEDIVQNTFVAAYEHLKDSRATGRGHSKATAGRPNALTALLLR